MATARTRETPPDTAAPAMTHREILEALSGLMLGLFVAILSSTVVSNALPTITAELHANETTYTWVITATLLATTVSTPIWGKLADLMSKKILIQLGLTVYVIGSAIAGLSQNSGMLIVARVIQGLGSRRPHRAHPGHHGGDDLAAGARPLLRLPGRGLRRRHDRRPARRRPHRRHLVARLALVLLRRRAVRGPLADRAAEDPEPAGPQAGRTHRLGRRDADHRRGLAAADLGLLQPAPSTTGCRGRPAPWSAARWCSRCSSSWSSRR